MLNKIFGNLTIYNALLLYGAATPFILYSNKLLACSVVPVAQAPS